MSFNLFQQTFYNNIKLLTIRGVQDIAFNVNKKVIFPLIIKLSEKITITSEIGDIFKIKGFLVNYTDLEKLQDSDFIIQFGETTYKIPFSFLIAKYNDFNTKNNIFIDFPHNFLFQHNIHLISMFYPIIFEPILTCDISIVLESTLLDVNERKQFAIQSKNYKIREISKFKLTPNSLIANNETYLTDSINTYISYPNPNFLSQGILIDIYKKNINSIHLSFNIMGDTNQIDSINYDTNLVQLYGENIRLDNNLYKYSLTYFGFDINESLFSKNMDGCINMSRVENVKVVIELDKNINEEDLGRNIHVYFISWNELQYNSGLIGIKYVP